MEDSKIIALLDWFAEARRYNNSMFNIGRDFYANRQATYSLLNRLKRDGCLKKSKTTGKSRAEWRITGLGLKKLDFLKKKKEKARAIGDFNGFLDKKGFNLVIFDIPEKQQEKRKWLRNLLTSIGYSMIQKSVWIGEKKPSRKFYKKLEDLCISPFVKVIDIIDEAGIKILKATNQPN
jgi:CRISPR-associated endonuclease Cas2